MDSVLTYSSAFKTRRFLNWLLMGMTYMMIYMGRYNLNAASHELEQLYGLSHSAYAQIGLWGFFVYGVAMILNGPLADKFGARKAIMLATAGSAVLNFCIGYLLFNEWVGKIAVSMAFLYAINMYFQSFIAIAVIKGNAPWFHVKERGVYGGWFGAILACGYFMALTVGGFILSYLPLPWVFFIPSAIIGLMFLLDWLFMRNKPSDAGLEDIDPEDATSKEIRGRAEKAMAWLKMQAAHPDRSDSRYLNRLHLYGLSMKQLLVGRNLEAIKARTRDVASLAGAVGVAFCEVKPRFFDVLKWAWSKRVVRRLTYSEFCTGFVRQGIMFWFILYLANIQAVVKGSLLYNVATLGVTVGGILGAIICGQLSDKVFGSRRPPVAFIFYAMQAVSLVLLANCTGPLMASLMIPVLAMWIFGVHGMLTGTATMDFGGSRGAATVTGMLDGIQYIASTICVFGMGWLMDNFGWTYWAYVLIPFSVAGALLMLTIWNARPGHEG
ncbi:MFS transporter [Candidatus Falkowbacteria bacterium]|nr:MFS transporter [Candidatus Falkowbacteria bacterium]